MHRAGQRCFELLALIGSPQLLLQSYSPHGQDSWIAIGYPYYKGSPCVTTEIITDKFDVLRGNEGRQTCRLWFLGHEGYDFLTSFVTTKDVKLVGYDFRGHTRGTLVVGIAYGCPYYKGSAIFSLVFFKYHKWKIVYSL